MPIQTEAPSRKSWRDVLPIHPAAELFPPMSSDELRELGADIVKKNGLVAPIALWRRNPNEPLQLLDGRNRLDAIELVTGRTVEIGAPSLMAGDFPCLRQGGHARPYGRSLRLCHLRQYPPPPS
jgi:hypothetical protein